MKCETFQLCPEYSGATLTTYISNDEPELMMPPRTALLIFPGGGYHWLSDREAEPIAKTFFGAGFNCFILRYSLNEDACFPKPLVEASLAMKHIRENAQAYNIDPERVFAIGFSAGGHLAASLGTLWHKDYVYENAPMPYGMNKPTGTILSYPVINGGPFAHRGSFDNLCGEGRNDPAVIEKYSIDRQVSEKTVPAFIWHTTDDEIVPVQNSLMMASALTAHNIPYEMHIYPSGPHGMSLCNAETWCGIPEKKNDYMSGWVRDAIHWIKSF